MSNKQQTKDLFNIPSEIMKFVKQDTYSLLIKGNAGTGKTTLALTILRALNIQKDFQYISTRVSPSQMYQYYPWFEQFFETSKKLQTSDMIENGNDATYFVDARLDEPVSLFERLTDQLMDNKAPMIIIDSWDTIGYFMDREALMNNARVLQTWRERAKAKMIFISEEPSVATFDFLADGVIDLRQRHHNDRLLREIFISKLRGVQINRPSYVYTLDNSIFHSYEPYMPSEFSISLDSRSVSSDTKNIVLKDALIKSGDAEMDNAVGGGFLHGGIVNIEIDSNVNEKIVLVFLSQIISIFLASENAVMYERTDQTNPEYISDYLKACLHTTKNDLDDQFFLANLQNNPIGKKVGKNQFLSLHNVTKKIKKKKPGKMLLSIISTEMLSQYNATKEDKKETDLLNFLKSISDLTIVVNHGSKSDTAECISRNADISIRFLAINGTLFMQSEMPWSHLYALMIDHENGYPHITFKPVV